MWVFAFREHTYSSSPPPEITCAPYCSPPDRSCTHTHTHPSLPSRGVWWMKGSSHREHSAQIRSIGAASTQTSTYSAEWCSACAGVFVHVCIQDHCVCLCHVWVCVPQRLNMSAQMYQMDLKSRCYLSLLHVACLAVSTRMFVQVKRSDSSMFAHICHVLLRVQTWTAVCRGRGSATTY